MGKSLADAMSAQPGPDSLAYWLAPLKGYWDRQGKMAQDGLTMADQGAQSVRAGDMGGLAGLLLGPASYLASPINALLPTSDEAYAASDLPEWSKPGVAGGLATMMAVMPGPKFKGLGRGMAELADGATDAERAALAARLESEATQPGGMASTVSRDEALANLTEAPEVIWTTGTLRANRPTKVFQPEMTPADMERMGLDPKKTYTPPKGVNSASYKVTYEDGTTGWAPGLLRAKRPPK